jgi:hypothetical protein
MISSALYTGKVFHARHIPKKHAFDYSIFLFWLALDEIDEVCQKVKWISTSRFSVVRYKRSDYLGDPELPLQSAVLQRMSELANKTLSGRVFMLGQMRIFGVYFSPVNFYYLQQSDGHYTHMLAEVSNTPWDQRHHYLVDLNDQKDCDKAFHVSPFNPIDMRYHWNIQQPGSRLALSLSCSKNEKHFEASLLLDRIQMNSNTLLRVLISIPNMAIKTLLGIYWQAFRLFIKGVPYFGHPGNKGKNSK